MFNKKYFLFVLLATIIISGVYFYVKNFSKNDFEAVSKSQTVDTPVVWKDEKIAIVLEYPSAWGRVMQTGGYTTPPPAKEEEYISEKRYVSGESLFSIMDDYDGGIKFTNGPETLIIKFVSLSDMRGRIWDTKGGEYISLMEDKENLNNISQGLVYQGAAEDYKVLLNINKNGVRIECFPSGTLSIDFKSCKFYSSAYGFEIQWSEFADGKHSKRINELLQSIKIK